MATNWDNLYAKRTHSMKSSAIRELLKLAAKPEVISFAGGMPAPELFPNAKVQEACDYVLTNYPGNSLQYGASEGYTPLRQWIADFTSRQGLKVSLDNVMITSGSQQALDLLGKIFIDPGDVILCEDPTYLGALQAWNAYEAAYTSVHSDGEGLDPAYLEKAITPNAKFLYLLPNFQNPTGTTLPLSRRQQVVEITNRAGVPIVEDDPYGMLRFEGEPLPTVLSLDAAAHSSGAVYEGNVIYLSTFSKILAPGLRLAWVVAAPEVISKLVQAKQGADLHTATFTQMVTYEVAKTGFIDEHVKKIIEVYRTRRDVMLDSLAEFMPQGVSWTQPEGGLFLWVTLPESMSSQEIFKAAIEENVAYVSGESFFPNGGGHNTMRLNFSMMNNERIADGIRRLSNVVKNNWKA